MEAIINKEFYSKLGTDSKIKINWNKNPIKMSLFLSFLTVDVIRSTDHLGVDNGWTRLVNNDAKLVVRGGVANGIEYLDCLEYGIKLHNQYNNFVNPFYLFDILKDDGKLFFLDYYKSEIEKIVSDKKEEITRSEKYVKNQKEILLSIEKELLTLNPTTK